MPQNAKLLTMLLVDRNTVWMPMEDMSKKMMEICKIDNKPADVGPQGGNTAWAWHLSQAVQPGPLSLQVVFALEQLLKTPVEWGNLLLAVVFSRL